MNGFLLFCVELLSSCTGFAFLQSTGGAQFLTRSELLQE